MCYMFGSQGIATLYKYWVCLVLEYGSILYFVTHLNCLDWFQSCVDYMCGFTFTFLTNQNASILGLTCHLVAGEGYGTL